MALSISPSYYWDGNDGNWSTFNVNVGTPSQQLRLLPATSLSAILVVIELGCSNSQYPANCAFLRGTLFHPDVSQDASWKPQQSSNGQPYFQLPFQNGSEQGLPDYNGTCEAGYDVLTLDWSGKSTPVNLQNQLIAGYAVPTPWLGMLGLSGHPSHIHNLALSEDSPLQSLLNSKSIPGLSWAYTAGAYYRNQWGSLTFGGYDASRVDMSSAMNVNMSTPQAQDLVVNIQSITITVDQSTTYVTDMPITAIIDSVVPEIWLPEKACATFEDVFGIVWNETEQIYLVNDTLHSALQAQDASITFFLADPTDASLATNITLPYAAFDLQAKSPLAGIPGNGTSLYYFPLKRTPSSLPGFQGYLGRTFLQEAYVIADYNRSSFQVARAKFPGNSAGTDIQVIYPPHFHHGLSVGAIVGIVIGAVAAVALVAGGLLFCFWWRPRQQRRQQKERTASTGRTCSIDQLTIVGDTAENETEMTPMGMQTEYFNKVPIENRPMKAELDASQTALSQAGRQTERAELDAGSVHLQRPGHRSQVSWGSAASGESGGSGISPIHGNDRIRSMLGTPSPPLYPSGSPSPPLSSRHHERHASERMGGLFEME